MQCQEGRLLEPRSACTGNQWRKHAPVQILALVAEYRERMEEQVVVLFQVLAAEINFGYKFQTVRTFLPQAWSASPVITSRPISQVTLQVLLQGKHAMTRGALPADVMSVHCPECMSRDLREAPGGG